MVNLSNEIIISIVVSICYIIYTHVTSAEKPKWSTYLKNGVFGFVSAYCVILVSKKFANSPSKPLVIGGSNYQETIQVGDPTF